MNTQTVKIGSKFFERELQVYANWREAFWRENIQNSVDAESSRLDITVEELTDNSSRVTFADNGNGMSRETLENIYFVLGETGKTGNGSIGGFGKARILTCFAQKRYTLYTHNLIVNGDGADYTIEETPEFYDGVKLIVDVKSSKEYLLEALTVYLGICYLPCKVFINGERWTKWTYARNHKRDLSFGGVYTNHSQDARLLVRVNGTLMFAKYISSPAQVILEITPSESRQVLLANRDGLVWEKQRELDSFISELNINNRSALRKTTNKSTTFKGTGTFSIKRRAKDANGMQVVRIPFSEIAQNDNLALVAPQRYHAPIDKDVEIEEFDISENIFNVKIDDDTTSPAIKRVIDTYDPRNWDLEGKGYRVRNGVRQYFRAGVDKYKLLLMWKVACEKVIEILLDNFHQAESGYNWGVGWVFSDYTSGNGYKTKARHSEENGVHYLLLNPVEDDGTMAYSIGSKDDMLAMITYAAHEVTHLVVSYHNEDFASLYTSLEAKLKPHLNRIVAAMREAKEILPGVQA